MGQLSKKPRGIERNLNFYALSSLLLLSDESSLRSTRRRGASRRRKPVLRQQTDDNKLSFFDFSSLSKVISISQGHGHVKKPQDLFKKPSLANTTLSSTVGISLCAVSSLSCLPSHLPHSHFFFWPFCIEYQICFHISSAPSKIPIKNLVMTKSRFQLHQ